MEKEKDLQEELKNISPLLAKMKEKEPQTGFSVPPNYFRNLTTEVMEKVAPPIVKRQWTWEYVWNQLELSLQPKFAAALTIAFLLVTGTWFFIKNYDTATLASSEPSLEELENYVVTNLDDFSEDLLVEFQTETPALDLNLDDENLDLLLEDLDIKDLL